MILNGAQILIEVLVEQGVDIIFGYPGGAVLNIYDELFDNEERIRHILTSHEQGAAHAADGYSRATGKTGVVLATSGPGSTNLVTGIATAFMDSIPMVAITGNVNTDSIGKDCFQEVYTAGITLPITKHNFVVREVSKLADTLREAFKIANSGRPGPVLVDIPKDLTLAKCEFYPQEPLNIDNVYVPDDQQLNTVAEAINNSERPLLYYGGGVISSGAYEQILDLVKIGNIPAIHSVMGKGIMPYDNPMNLGMIGMHGSVAAMLAVKKTDLLIAVGARFSDRTANNGENFVDNAKIIQIDIDDCEVNKNIPADYSVIGDVRKVLKALLPKIETKERSIWIEEIADMKNQDYIPIDTEDRLKPHQIIEDIYQLCPDNLIVTTDVGQHQMWAAQYCKSEQPRSFLTSAGLGTMGFGYGAAIGAKLGCPNHTVVHITGDGSFHMNMNEVPTAVTYSLPIITIVMNNNALGMVRQLQKVYCNSRFSSTLLQKQTDYVKLADAFGALGFRAKTPKEFKLALKEALKSNRPCIIECPIDCEEQVLPMMPAGATVDDIIIE
jgi:acetolactate synthase-1/2/3 large subunit